MIFIIGAAELEGQEVCEVISILSVREELGGRRSAHSAP